MTNRKQLKKLWMRWRVSRNPSITRMTQSQLNDLYENNPQMLASSFAIIIRTLYLAFSFSLFSPCTTLYAIATLALLHWCDKYLLLRFYSNPPPMSASILRTVLFFGGFIPLNTTYTCFNLDWEGVLVSSKQPGRHAVHVFSQDYSLLTYLSFLFSFLFALFYWLSSIGSMPSYMDPKLGKHNMDVKVSSLDREIMFAIDYDRANPARLLSQRAIGEGKIDDDQKETFRIDVQTMIIDMEKVVLGNKWKVPTTDQHIPHTQIRALFYNH
eukprot:TRINITY_DN4387_c0_g1_i2.p2 TRINITY_DN4387_c0_g1~~TRINITY_DN4387_c0_g1_i2.p2  ORF type:complete len:269 (+),score=-1.85 TRINITY_DN4387_c0_g1_i2:731-1537(+)